MGGRYQRAQVPLPEMMEMDDVTSVGKLEALAKAHVKTKAWDAVVEWTNRQLEA